MALATHQEAVLQQVHVGSGSTPVQIVQDLEALVRDRREARALAKELVQDVKAYWIPFNLPWDHGDEGKARLGRVHDALRVIQRRRSRRSLERTLLFLPGEQDWSGTVESPDLGLLCASALCAKGHAILTNISSDRRTIAATLREHYCIACIGYALGARTVARALEKNMTSPEDRADLQSIQGFSNDLVAKILDPDKRLLSDRAGYVEFLGDIMSPGEAEARKKLDIELEGIKGLKREAMEDVCTEVRRKGEDCPAKVLFPDRSSQKALQELSKVKEEAVSTGLGEDGHCEELTIRDARLYSPKLERSTKGTWTKKLGIFQRISDTVKPRFYYSPGRSGGGEADMKFFQNFFDAYLEDLTGSAHVNVGSWNIRLSSFYHGLTGTSTIKQKLEYVWEFVQKQRLAVCVLQEAPGACVGDDVKEKFESELRYSLSSLPDRGEHYAFEVVPTGGESAVFIWDKRAVEPCEGKSGVCVIRAGEGAKLREYGHKDVEEIAKLFRRKRPYMWDKKNFEDSSETEQDVGQGGDLGLQVDGDADKGGDESGEEPGAAEQEGRDEHGCENSDEADLFKPSKAMKQAGDNSRKAFGFGRPPPLMMFKVGSSSGAGQDRRSLLCVVGVHLKAADECGLEVTKQEAKALADVGLLMRNMVETCGRDEDPTQEATGADWTGGACLLVGDFNLEPPGSTRQQNSSGDAFEGLTKLGFTPMFTNCQETSAGLKSSNIERLVGRPALYDNMYLLTVPTDESTGLIASQKTGNLQLLISPDAEAALEEFESVMGRNGSAYKSAKTRLFRQFLAHPQVKSKFAIMFFNEFSDHTQLSLSLRCEPEPMD